MRDPIGALAAALQRDEGGLAIVWCPDLGLRDWLAGQVESLAPTGTLPLRLSGVEDAIGAPDRMRCCSCPLDERAVVLDTDASRDRLLEPPRARPVVLLPATRRRRKACLAEDAPSLWSWAMGGESRSLACPIS